MSSYEEVYLRAYDSASQAKYFIGRYVSFYNQQRPRSALGGQTPEYTSISRWEKRHNLEGSSHNESRLGCSKTGATSDRERAARAFGR
jgi:hypothetical protein